ncbi:PadR family transcriptional regulator [Haloarchaeobius sp. HME9146]|uniref:PadR family transcriptional regulator n=1 Tax=unclassified Haloarchaeobius TaxID=2614452 RepID=UPI0021C0498E|nr:PadR family transcriptional regulator [Haloarchaeobius sp. HME9146]MCT9095663.1 PadR family transcriptional regulator [Haloarchaeobius sp. HME9146]
MRTDLTGFQHNLLVVLTKMDEPSGRDLKQEIEDSLDTSLPHGRLYRNLDTLVEKGLVEKGCIDGRTNFYEISEEGAEAIRERYRWEREHIEPELTS